MRGKYSSGTLMSHAQEARLGKTSFGPNCSSPAMKARTLTTDLCGTCTPLGRPVEPDVKITYITSSGLAIAGRLSTASDPTCCQSESRHKTLAHPGGIALVKDTCVRIHREAASSRIVRRRSGGCDGSSGT